MSDCIWVTRTGNMTRDNVTSVTPARRKLKRAQALNIVVVTMHCKAGLLNCVYMLCGFIKSALDRPPGESIMFFPTNVCI